MKRVFAFLLALVFILGMCACGRPATVDEDIQDDSEQITVEITPTPSPTPTSTPTPTPEPTKSPGTDVHDAFDKATSLEKKDLTTDETGAYCYKGIRLPVQDASDIFGELAIAQCAVYNGIARRMEQICANDGLLFPSSDDEFYQILLGTDKPESYEEFKSIVRSLGDYIVFDPTEREIFNAFASLDCVDGDIDIENREYSFTIHDLEKAAEELQISEEMLGYMLAFTTIYPPIQEGVYQWGENSLTINLTVGIPPNNPPVRSYDVDNPSYINNGEFNYTCADFTYALNDIISQMDRGLRTLKSSEHGNISWIYHTSNRADAIATLVFSGKDGAEELDSDDDFKVIFSGLPNSDYLAQAFLAMVVAIDPSFTFDEARTICIDLIDGLESDVAPTIDVDGISIGIVVLDANELSVLICVSQ